MFSPLENSDELLSAYLDGELSAEQQALVEQALAESSEWRQAYEELRELRAGLQSLPGERLDQDFAQRVLQRIEREQRIAGEIGGAPRSFGGTRTPPHMPPDLAPRASADFPARTSLLVDSSENGTQVPPTAAELRESTSRGPIWNGADFRWGAVCGVAAALTTVALFLYGPWWKSPSSSVVHHAERETADSADGGSSESNGAAFDRGVATALPAEFSQADEFAARNGAAEQQGSRDKIAAADRQLSVDRKRGELPPSDDMPMPLGINDLKRGNARIATEGEFKQEFAEKASPRGGREESAEIRPAQSSVGSASSPDFNFPNTFRRQALTPEKEFGRAADSAPPAAPLQSRLGGGAGGLAANRAAPAIDAGRVESEAETKDQLAHRELAKGDAALRSPQTPEVMVVHVAVTADALDRRLFDSLLPRHGISLESGHDLEADVRRDSVNSPHPTAQPHSPPGEPPAVSAGELEVVYVLASEEQLRSVLGEIGARSEDFPRVELHRSKKMKETPKGASPPAFSQAATAAPPVPRLGGDGLSAGRAASEPAEGAAPVLEAPARGATAHSPPVPLHEDVARRPTAGKHLQNRSGTEDDRKGSFAAPRAVEAGADAAPADRNDSEAQNATAEPPPAIGLAMRLEAVKLEAVRLEAVRLEAARLERNIVEREALRSASPMSAEGVGLHAPGADGEEPHRQARSEDEQRALQPAEMELWLELDSLHASDATVEKSAGERTEANRTAAHPNGDSPAAARFGGPVPTAESGSAPSGQAPGNAGVFASRAVEPFGDFHESTAGQSPLRIVFVLQRLTAAGPDPTAAEAVLPAAGAAESPE